MNHINDQIEMPKVVRDGAPREDYDNISVGEWERQKIVTKIILRDKWAERLWSCMSWFIFLFNAFVAVNFCVRILTNGSDVATNMEFVIIVATMCATYGALLWAHHNILRKKDGLE